MAPYAVIISDLNSAALGEVVSTHHSETAAEKALHKTVARGAYVAQRLPNRDWEHRLDARDRREMAPSVADRQARSRKARAEAGGKQIAVMLTRSASAKLAAHVAQGETIAAVINRLLSRSRP